MIHYPKMIRDVAKGMPLVSSTRSSTMSIANEPSFVFQLLQTQLASADPISLSSDLTQATWHSAIQYENQVLQDQTDPQQAMFSLRQIERSYYLARSIAVELLEPAVTSQMIISETQPANSVCLATAEEAQNHLNYYLTGFNNWNILFDLDWSQMVATGDAMSLLVLEAPQIASSNFEGAAGIFYKDAKLDLLCCYPEHAGYEAHVAKVIASLDTKLKKRGRKVIQDGDATIYQNAALKHDIAFRNVASRGCPAGLTGGCPAGLTDPTARVMACRFPCNRIMYTGRDFLLTPSAMVSMAAGTVVSPSIPGDEDIDKDLLQFAKYGYIVICAGYDRPIAE